MSQMKNPNEKRKVHTKELDRLYAKNVRCPYCKERIKKYQMKCGLCGISKEDILVASNQSAKLILAGKKQGKVTWTKKRPQDVRFGKLIFFLVIFGVFGAHNFVVGRKRRGWILLACMTIFIISVIVFPPNFDYTGTTWRYAWRNDFASWGWWFPFDTFGILAVLVWFVDWFAIIIFQSYKYPIHIPADATELAKLNKQENPETKAPNTNNSKVKESEKKGIDEARPKKHYNHSKHKRQQKKSQETTHPPSQQDNLPKP
ncbi:MAG: TM2 domain-containing protein [Firmicutes bacterium]|nr:TM2 domain-containing protein [Bacillota bacterium]